MTKKHKKMFIITSLICLLPIIVGLIMWNQLPEQMNTHFNFQGEADGASPKAFAVFGLPGIVFGVHILCALITGADPKKNSIGDKIYTLILWICPLIAAFISVLIYGPHMGIEIDVLLACNLLMAVMFLVLGNYMPKCRQNYTIGIKISWTLGDEDNWNKTHRFAGWVWMLGGVVMLLNCFFNNMIVLLVVLMVITIAPIIYSGLYYTKKKKAAKK